MKTITISISEILSLVSCAEDYGFGDDALLSTFAEWVEDDITKEDLEKYASDLAKKEGYGEEDYDACIHNLTEWYNRYVK